MRSPAREGAAASAATATASSNAEIKHLADRLHTAQVKVKRLARVEAAIVDMFIEIMERTASMPSSLRGATQDDAADDNAFARAKRKEEYLKKAEGDPISLLNALRTHLRVQLTTHEQQHLSILQTITDLTAKVESTTVDARRDVGQWEHSCQVLRQQMQALAQQLTVTQADSDRIARQYTRSLEQLNVEVNTLRSSNEAQREQLSKRQADVEELKQANDRLARERKRVTDEMNKTTAAHGRGNGGAGSPANAAYIVNGQTPAEQQNLKRVLHDYECQLSKLESANEELRRELHRQQQHLASVKQSTQAQHCAKLEKDLKKHRDLAGTNTVRLAEQDAELLRTRGFLKERDALIQNMKDEYNKLFTALHKIKQNPSTQTRQLTRSASSSSVGMALKKDGRQSTGRGEAADRTSAEANENPYLLSHYKAKIEQQAKEIERLQTHLRKLIATEYRHKQNNKLLRVERIELMDTCDSLRGQVERAVMTTAKAMAHQYSEDGVPGGGDAKIDEPETDGGDDLFSADGLGDSNRFCCSISDVKRLRQRNQFLEDRLRKVSNAGTSGQPPRHRSASAMRRSSSAIEIPTTGEELPMRSIDSKTMEALQQVKSGMRARPQSAGQRASPLLRPQSAVVTKSLL